MAMYQNNDRIEKLEDHQVSIKKGILRITSFFFNHIEIQKSTEIKSFSIVDNWSNSRNSHRNNEINEIEKFPKKILTLDY